MSGNITTTWSWPKHFTYFHDCYLHSHHFLYCVVDFSNLCYNFCTPCAYSCLRANINIFHLLSIFTYVPPGDSIGELIPEFCLVVNITIMTLLELSVYIFNLVVTLVPHSYAVGYLSSSSAFRASFIISRQKSALPLTNSLARWSASGWLIIPAITQSLSALAILLEVARPLPLVGAHLMFSFI